jgi:hypothetical protein
VKPIFFFPRNGSPKKCLFGLYQGESITTGCDFLIYDRAGHERIRSSKISDSQKRSMPTSRLAKLAKFFFSRPILLDKRTRMPGIASYRYPSSSTQAARGVCATCDTISKLKEVAPSNESGAVIERRDKRLDLTDVARERSMQKGFSHSYTSFYDKSSRIAPEEFGSCMPS